ncbi:MAG: TetR/AcrR family transcriptional regulator [Acidobacteria bacterium]|nr:TetR/AcrR family transcriptional regulator [Acidobacteriota bacterium]
MKAKPQRQPGTRLGEPTLTARDWIEAALQMLAEAGPTRVTVAALAARLGVTKGSFYWHFRSRTRLLEATLERWEQRATSESIRALEEVPDVRGRLELIVEASSQQPRSHSIYAALAEWSGDKRVRRVLNRVATRRVQYLESCYLELGMPRSLAEARALLTYAAYRGLLQLAREAPSVLPKEWSTYPRLAREVLIPRRKGRQSA